MDKNQTNLDLFDKKELEVYETLTLNTENLNAQFEQEFLIDTDDIILDESVQEKIKENEIEDSVANTDLSNEIEDSVANTDLSNEIEDSVANTDVSISSENISDNLNNKQLEIDLIQNNNNLKENEIKEKTNESDKITISSDNSTLENKSDFGKVNIMAIGIGGCGCNAINRMEGAQFKDIKLVAIDTSIQTLDSVNADIKLLVGEDTLGGHGSGNDVEKATEAILNVQDDIKNILKGVDMVFLTAGMGRGTGSAGLVEIGRIAREMGILTIGFAILPGRIEADMRVVETYYQQFVDSVDSNIVIENDKVNKYAADLPIGQARKIADQMLIDGIKGISDLITNPGKINLDYADIRTAFQNQGSCVMGIGYGEGEAPVIKAIENSINADIINPSSLSTAQTIIFNITCSSNTITIKEAAEGTELIYSKNSSNNIKHMLFGYSYDESLGEKIKVTFIATGTTPIDFEEYKKVNNDRSSLFSSGRGNDINVDIFSTTSRGNGKPDFLK